MHTVDSYKEQVEDRPNSKSLLVQKEQLERELGQEFDAKKLDRLESIMCYRGWKRTNAKTAAMFARDESGLKETHFERRMYLRRHPRHKYLEQLGGHDWSTLAICTMAAATNLLLAYLWGRTPGSIASHPWLLLGSVCLIGASIQALMGVVIHDAGHNLVAPQAWINKLSMLIANVPLIVPMAFSFKRYHFLHHVYQGVVGKDPDLPLSWEIPLIRGRWYAKLIWIAMYPFMYLIRGAAQNRKPSDWELYNWAFMILVDALIYRICGWQGMIFLAASMWFGYSFHPAAAHFIQEHYTFIDGQETYSYYGPLNSIFMNIGFHNEHHDILSIPWRRLPLIRELVPSMYKRLNHHPSWLQVHWQFILHDYLGPSSRVTRPDTRGIRCKEE
jgi:sphingolipid delta-4 desaturase